jgi:UDP-N-acetylglucosamine acyltransferase
VPPFMIVEGHKGSVRGVNQVGMERGGFDGASIERLRDVYKQIYRSKSFEPRRRILERVRAEHGQDRLVLELVQALQNTEMGPKGRYRETLRESFHQQGRARILDGERA